MRQLLLFVLLAIGLPGFSQTTYIRCGQLIDGRGGHAANMTIIVSGNTIKTIKKGMLGGPGDSIIDLSQMAVLPGLIDCHVHLEYENTRNSFADRFREKDADIAYKAAANAHATLMAGFTTVRDLGGSGVNVSLRNAIKKGLAIGPNILTAEKAISASGGHMDPTVGLREDAYRHDPGPENGIADGQDEVMKAVRYRFKNGADVIKIASTGGVLDLSKDGSGAQYSVAEIKTIVTTAADYGMKVACHAHGAEGIKRAIRGGVTSIEHGTFMDAEGMNMAKEKGVWLVPTLTAGQSVADSALIPGFFPEVVAKKARNVGPQIQKTFARAYKAGVKIAFGTDAGVFPHGKNYLEFRYMQDAGMPLPQAIQAATSHAAKLLGIDKERGSIAPGMLADIIAIDGDPLHNADAFGHVVFVMKEGKVYKH